MKFAVVIDRGAYDAAIAAAESVGQAGATIRGYAAPVDGPLAGWVREAWDALRDGLDRVYAVGREAARSQLDAAQQTLERVLQEAGRRAQELVAALRAKIAQYLTTLVNEMLAQVRPTLKVGGVELKLNELRIEQKLLLAGSLKASIEEAVSLTSDSEISVEASYAAG
jgi:hypothetical protein